MRLFDPRARNDLVPEIIGAIGFFALMAAIILGVSVSDGLDAHVIAAAGRLQ